MEQQIRELYLSCDEYQKRHGLQWYQNANTETRFIAKENCIPVWKVAGIISALSVGVQWEANLREAEKLISTLARGRKSKVSTYGVQLQKAVDIYNTDKKENVNGILKGPKTRAFFNNIAYPNICNSVTVDRWILRIFNEPQNVKPKRYKEIERAFRTVAKELHLRPLQLQAICWLSKRDRGQYHLFEE